MNFKCPNPACGQTLEVDDAVSGTLNAKCPRCGQMIQLVVEESAKQVLEPTKRAAVVRMHEIRQHRSLMEKTSTRPKPVRSGCLFRVVAWSSVLCLLGVIVYGIWYFSSHTLRSVPVSIPLPLSEKEPDVKILDWQLLTQIVENTGHSKRTISLTEEFAKRGGHFLVVHPKLSAAALAGVPLGPGKLKSHDHNKPIKESELTLAGIKKRGGVTLFTYDLSSNGEGLNYLFDVGHFVLHAPDGRTLVASLVGYNLSTKGLLSSTDIEIGTPTPLVGNELAAIFSVTETEAELAAFQFRYKNFPAQRLELARVPPSD